jgi:uncharacterized protein (DUF433 family)
MTHRLFSSSDESTAAEARLRAYLDALEKPVTSLGADARSDWRSEAEQHLRSLIAANEELGSSHAEAVAEALKQFSRTPERIGGQVCWESMRSAPDVTLMQIAARATVQFVVLAFYSLTALGAAACWYIRADDASGVTLLRIAGGLGFVLIPMIGGWKIGKLLAEWKASGGVRSASSWQRPRVDRVPLPFRLHERLPDGDLLPAILVAAAVSVAVPGGLFALCSTNLGGQDGADPRMMLAGLLWLPVVVAFAAVSWRLRIRRVTPAAAR